MAKWYRSKNVTPIDRAKVEIAHRKNQILPWLIAALSLAACVYLGVRL